MHTALNRAVLNRWAEKKEGAKKGGKGEAPRPVCSREGL